MSPCIMFHLLQNTYLYGDIFISSTRLRTKNQYHRSNQQLCVFVLFLLDFRTYAHQNMFRPFFFLFFLSFVRIIIFFNSSSNAQQTNTKIRHMKCAASAKLKSRIKWIQLKLPPFIFAQPILAAGFTYQMIEVAARGCSACKTSAQIPFGRTVEHRRSVLLCYYTGRIFVFV